MTRAERLRALFDEARAVPPDERRAWLDAHEADAALRAEVAELLASDAARWSFVDEGTEALPAVVGEYRLVRWLGAGATGTVFEARCLTDARPVALKLLKPALLGGPARRRFEREGDLAGRLDHPAIARVLGRGELDVGFGRVPYLELELVDGLPLDIHCEREGLGVDAILDLVGRVAEAVVFAHERGVVHRDLKPANVLVDASGAPKLLDFGVARADLVLRDAATSLHTETGQLLGTLRTMSPEQACGRLDEVDERTDLYALGVITYELLAGRPPYRVDGLPIPEAIDTIARAEPEPLSSFVPSLTPDVERVLMAALEKRAVDRYPSVRAWLDDLACARAGRATRRRAEPAWRPLVRFARRHPGLVRSVVGGAALLSIGLVAALLAWWDAREQRRLADDSLAAERRLRGRLADTVADLERSMTDAKVMLAFLDATWDAFEPREGEQGVTARDVLDRAAGEIDVGALWPEAALRLHVRLGESYAHIGFQQPAARHWDAALAIVDELGPDHPDGLAARIDATQFWNGVDRERARREFDALERIAGERALSPGVRRRIEILRAAVADARPVAEREALDARRFEQAAAEPDDVEARLYAVQGHAGTLIESGRFDEATAQLGAALAEAREVLGAEHRATLALSSELAYAHREAGDLRGAEALYRELLERHVALHGEGHPETMRTRNNLAVVLNLSDRVAEAAELLDVVVSSERVDDGSRSHATALMNRGLSELARARHEAARPLLTEALAAHRTAYGDLDVNTVRALENLAQACIALGDFDEAERLLDEAERTTERQGHDVERVFVRVIRARLEAWRGDVAAALTLGAQAVELGGRLFAVENAQYALVLVVHAQLLEVAERHEEAFATFRRVADSGLDPAANAAWQALAGTGRTLVALGRVDDGRALLEAVRAGYDEQAGAVAECRLGLGRASLAAGDASAAEPDLRAAHAWRRAEGGPGHALVLDVLVDWCEALRALDRADEAAELLAESLAAAGLEPGPDALERLAATLVPR